MYASKKICSPAGEILFDILKMRMAKVNWCEAARACKTESTQPSASPQSIDAFLCSGAFADNQGGIQNIVEMARSMRAKKLMVIDSDDDGQFHAAQEMNGKLIESLCHQAVKASQLQRIIICKWLQLCY